MSRNPQQIGECLERPDVFFIKERLTISVLWQILRLPGTPRKSCRSPFREDQTPSFSIYNEDRRWKDSSTGEGGDAIDFLAKAHGLTQKEAFKSFLNIAKEHGYVRG